MTKRVRISDVAEQAGVSVTTVSHALSGQGNLSAATRERVQRIAEELGYAPSRIATALRLQRSGIIGFVSDEIATTPFAGKIVLGAQEAAAERSLLLMVVNSNSDDRVENQQISSLLAQQVDAIVYARMSHTIVTLPTRLRQIPTVTVDAETLGDSVPWVVPDEVGIGRIATERLIAAGHRRIAHLTVDESVPSTEGRILGYQQSMQEHGLEPVIVSATQPANARAGREAFAKAMVVIPDMTAVFSFNDPMALGVYQAAMEAGLRVPSDLSVVGVDNLEVIADQIRPGLTTVGLPHYEMGRWAIERLGLMIGNDDWAADSTQVRLSSPLIERGSVAPPAAKV